MIHNPAFILLAVAIATVCCALWLRKSLRYSANAPLDPLPQPFGIRTVSMLPVDSGAANDRIEIIPDNDLKMQYGCGHESWAEFVTDVFGQKRRPATVRPGEVRPLCPECVRETMLTNSIRCCKCGWLIEPGSCVALYPADEKGVRPDIASTAPDGRLIGCNGYHCCANDEKLAGHWTGEAFEPLSPSLLRNNRRTYLM